MVVVSVVVTGVGSGSGGVCGSSGRTAISSALDVTSSGFVLVSGCALVVSDVCVMFGTGCIAVLAHPASRQASVRAPAAFTRLFEILGM